MIWISSLIERQTFSDSFSVTVAFSMGWNKVVKTVHIELLEITPANHKRGLGETRQDILKWFPNFKSTCNNKMNVKQFSCFLKNRLRSSHTAVAEESTAMNGAGVDPGVRARLV
jgi:hypothetical protein